MKSQAVRSEGAGMPGVSGELNASGLPSWLGLAKLPGVVVEGVVPGFPPTGGSRQLRCCLESIGILDSAME
jgi:hypothetical protein